MQKSLWGLIAAITIWLAAITNAWAMPSVMTLEEIEPGMRGIGKTVVIGKEIETFDVEIRGVLEGDAGDSGRIIAQVSGDLIDRTDGVLQGMSGSPVYIDGRLIGAVSAGWQGIDNRTCLITPINYMTALWNLPDNGFGSKIESVKIKQAAEKVKEEPVKLLKERLRSESAKPQESAVQPETVEPTTEQAKESPAQEEAGESLATPLFASGFSAGALELLGAGLKDYGVVPYAVSGKRSTDYDRSAQVKPGGAIGVQIVRGDMSLAAIGTVTAVDGDRVVAFGHPFIRKGNVNFFMTDAQIITTANSKEAAGFKIGSPGAVIGRINQDRGSGVAGVIGQYPSVVPLGIAVRDKQLGKDKYYDMQIAYDEDLLPTVTAAMVYSAIDQTIDRVGEGTATVSFEIKTNGAADGTVKRDNMFFDTQNVGLASISEIGQVLNILCNNAMMEADIVGIKVNIDIDQDRNTASIVEAVADKMTVKPGDDVKLTLKLKPYRRPAETLIVSYKVPKYQAAGPLNLEIRGGGLISIMQMMMMQQGLNMSAEEDKTVSLQDKIKEFTTANRNNEIVIAPALMIGEPENPLAASGAKPDKMKKTRPQAEAKDESTANGKELQSEEASVKHKSTYIIDNIVRLTLTVQN